MCNKEWYHKALSPQGGLGYQYNIKGKGEGFPTTKYIVSRGQVSMVMWLA